MKDHVLNIINEGYRIFNPFTGKTIGKQFNEPIYLVWNSESTSGVEYKSYKTITGAFKNWDLNS